MRNNERVRSELGKRQFPVKSYMGFNPEEQPSARTIANRLNAQKSTGPKTPQGKARSSQNALKHGLTAATHMQTVFDEGEDFADFQAGLLEHFQPGTRYEAALVDRIITLMWRLRRVPIIEAAIMDHKGARRETNPRSMAYLRDGGCPRVPTPLALRG